MEPLFRPLHAEPPQARGHSHGQFATKLREGGDWFSDGAQRLMAAGRLGAGHAV